MKMPNVAITIVKHNGVEMACCNNKTVAEQTQRQLIFDSISNNVKIQDQEDFYRNLSYYSEYGKIYAQKMGYTMETFSLSQLIALHSDK